MAGVWEKAIEERREGNREESSIVVRKSVVWLVDIVVILASDSDKIERIGLAHPGRYPQCYIDGWAKETTQKNGDR